MMHGSMNIKYGALDVKT